MKRTPFKRSQKTPLLRSGFSQTHQSPLKRVTTLKTQNMKPQSVTQLKKKADKVFSDFIRQRDDGICFTCGNRKEWKYQQNGHYMSRSYLNTRYDEENCHCQCVGCNMFKGGNMPSYAIMLQQQYGEHILKTLYDKAHKIKKSGIQFYKDIIDKYGSH